MTERDRKILEMQCESTRRCLERPPDLDLEWLSRPIPKEAQVLKSDGSVDLNVRAFSEEEVRIESKIRYERGGHLAKMRNEPEAKAVSEQRKKTAIEAFMTSKTVEGIKSAFKAIMAQVEDVSVKMGVRFREE